MLKHFNILLISFITIFSLKVFEARFFPVDYTLYLQFLTTLVVIGISAPFVFRKIKGFILPIILIILSIGISIPMAMIFWDQGLTDTIKATLPYFLWFFFFYLLYIRFSIKTLEYIIVGIAIVYILIFVFQYLNSHIALFGTSDQFTKERGVTRISIPGGGLLLLAAFIALNKFSNRAKGKWLWLGLSILGFIFPFSVATRQLIATIVFIYIYHFIRKVNFVKKAAILGTLVSFYILASTLDIPVLNGIKEANKETFAKGEEDIRVLSGKYYLTEFSPTIANKILGNGVAYGRKTAYGRFLSDLSNNKHFHISDIGLIGLYALFGILPVLAYFIIWYKSITVKVPDEYNYVKYYLWFVFITCLTSSTVFNVNYIMSSVFVLYIYHSIYKYEKYKHLLVRELWNDHKQNVKVESNTPENGVVTSLL